MKLLWCEKCKEYREGGNGIVEVNLPLVIDKNSGWFRARGDTGDCFDKEWSLDNVKCDKCGEFMKIMEVGKCPHLWCELKTGVRLCMWCGQSWTASKIIWKLDGIS